MVLEGYQTLRAWIEAGNGRPLFERLDQINWFIRSHREELIRSKALLPGRGSRPSMVSGRFTEVVTRIVKREGSMGEVG